MSAGTVFHDRLQAVYPFCCGHCNRSAVQSVDELEAAEKQAASAAGGGAAGGGGAGRIFMPKSVRQAMQREAAAEAADRDLKEEALVRQGDCCPCG